jgi:hypothetical protein
VRFVLDGRLSDFHIRFKVCHLRFFKRFGCGRCRHVLVTRVRLVRTGVGHRISVFAFDRCGPECLDQARAEHGAGWLGRLWRLRGLAAGLFGGRRVGEERTCWQRNLALAGLPLHELARHDLFDRARRALDVDAGLRLEQGHGLLTRKTEQLRDLVHSNSCQIRS